MSLPRPSGLKAPSKIGKPSGLQAPKTGTGIPTPGSVHKAQSAIAKSARAAGISAVQAERYAADIVKSFKGPELPNPPPPADDFIIGDRVWVSGTKPGFIAYLGETQFAQGEWAGVVLDKQDGKNDGSVQGIRYFQCEPKRGVFARISKLSRTPGIVPSSTPKPDDLNSETGANSVKTAPNGSGLMRPTTPKLMSSRGPTGSSQSLSKSPPPTSVPKASSTPMAKGGLRIGDRVLVSGTKTGTLRFIGATDFAKGDWAGVELDEKQGKNDGAVAGKRYFDCKPMYGLFAPVHKVAKLASGSAGAGTASTTPSPQARSLMNTSLRLTRERSGSQESVSSISSSASSVSRSRVRLGVTSLNNQLPMRRLPKQSPSPSAKTSQRPSTLNLSATTAALQKALKEKEEHIEQLLRERDLERSEVARAAAHVDKAEGEITSLRHEHEKFKDDADDTVMRLKASLSELEKEKSELLCKLEDERRKVEDLQFQIEEEAITKDDLQSRTEEEEAKLKDLEKNLKKEKEKSDKLEQEIFGLKAMLKDQTDRFNDLEETNTTYLDQIEELTHKLSQSDSKVKVFESTRLEEGAKTSQVSIELSEKTSRLSELEDVLSTRNREIKELHSKLTELTDELKHESLRKQKMQDTIDNLNEQLHSSGDTSKHQSIEIQNLKSQVSDLQRRLDSSQEKEKNLNDEKLKVEEQMSEMMRNSGDSSKRLSLLNDQLTEKNRKIQELQDDLSSSTQKWGKLNDDMNQLREESEREKQNLINQHTKSIQSLNSQMEDLQQALDKANKKTKEITEDLTKDKNDAINRKISEINQIKKSLEQSKEDLEKQQVQTQAHKEVLDSITMEKEALKFEKEKAEKHVKRLESEKETINTELIHARVEVSKIQSHNEKVLGEKDGLLEQIQELKSESEQVSKSKKELQTQKEEAESEKDKMKTDLESLQLEAMEHKASIQQKDMSIEELQKEVDRLKQETQQQQEKLATVSEQASSTGDLQAQLLEKNNRISDLQKSLHESEGEMDVMKTQLEFSALVSEEKKRLEDQNHQLTKDVDALQSRFSKELEKQETARKTLQSELDNSSELLQQRLEELEEHRQQITNLKNENTSLQVYQKSVTSLETERIELKEKVRSLEAALSEARETNANNIDVPADAVSSKLKEDKESAEAQVNFLNSVIVDLQAKNQELKIRLEAMESGVTTNGASDTSMDADSSSKRAPPRLFCDICDVFDKHDTDDCPLQAMDYEDEPSPSHHHGDRKTMRPYCDICEEFHEQCQGAAPVSPVEIKVLAEAESVQYDEETKNNQTKTGGPLDYIFGSDKKDNNSTKPHTVVYHSFDDSVEIKTLSGENDYLKTDKTPYHQSQDGESYHLYDPNLGKTHGTREGGAYMTTTNDSFKEPSVTQKYDEEDGNGYADNSGKYLELDKNEKASDGQHYLDKTDCTETRENEQVFPNLHFQQKSGDNNEENEVCEEKEQSNESSFVPDHLDNKEDYREPDFISDSVLKEDELSENVCIKDSENSLDDNENDFVLGKIDKEHQGSDKSCEEISSSGDIIENEKSEERIDSNRAEYLEAIKDLCEETVHPHLQQDPLGLISYTDTYDNNDDDENEERFCKADMKVKTSEKDCGDTEEHYPHSMNIENICEEEKGETGVDVSAQDLTSTSDDFQSGRESIYGSTDDVSDIVDDVVADENEEERKENASDNALTADSGRVESLPPTCEERGDSQNEMDKSCDSKKDENCHIS